MIRFILFISLIFLTSCSFNKNSKFWNSKNMQNSIVENQTIEVKKYSSSMTYEEFEEFINDYAKKSSYPDINK